MPKFAANLTMLFQEVPFLERFSKAKSAGFSYVEYLFPYAWEPNVLAEQLTQNSLTQVLFNLPAGNWAAGERGIACLPERTEEFKRGVSLAAEYAFALNVKQVNCLAGIRPKTLKHEIALDTLMGNLQYAADYLAKDGTHLVIEPINSRIDMPGFFLDQLSLAAQIIDELNHPNISLQFDIYHTHIMNGNVEKQFLQHLDKIAHIQFADFPGRHEPGTGEIDFSTVFEAIQKSNYSGYISAEYIPSQTSKTSLDWLQTFN